jgi:hypothetical protein
MASKLQTFPLELSERPVLEVHAAAERIRLVPVERGGTPRVEIEGGRTEVPPLEFKRDGDTLTITSSTNPAAWPWPGAGMVKKMTLYVPEHVRARVRQDFGQLFAERLAGCDLELSASAGTIALEDVRGRLKIAVDSGSVTGERLGGTFDVVSQAGSVKLGIYALDPGEHRVRTAMGSVKLMLAPEVKVKMEAHTTLGSTRVAHPNTPDAEARLTLWAELGSIKVKTGDEFADPRHGDGPDWRRFWRDIADKAIAVAFDATASEPPPPPAPARPVPDAELRKVLELVETGKLSAPDAERLIRAMGH